MDLAKLHRINQLFEIYHSLLTDKQQEMLRLYYNEDYSLAEIATYYHISRQAVRDNIKRAEHILEHYEDELNLYSQQLERKELIDCALLYSQKIGHTDLINLLNKLKQMDE